ncbi:MAG: alpha/beta hydrolase [Pseudomonadales bacterium]|nr:alpha/beta hydrolase [Pseudomonadales bacterium]
MHTLNTQTSLKRSHLELGISALNGLVGDNLREKDSALSVTMGFYHKNRRIALTSKQFKNLQPAATTKIAILVHGLSSHEQMWSFPSEANNDMGLDDGLDISYGSLLANDFGYTPLYVRFNSGLHISENGRYLSSLIEGLMEVYPLEIEDIVLIGHSLGGLVIRSAGYYAENFNTQWHKKVGKAFYIGTPHLGTPWEEATDGLYQWLDKKAHPVAKMISGIYSGRSSAIQDLRYARLIDEDWQNNVTKSTAIPWLKDTDHHFIVGTLLNNPSHPVSSLIGDLLVPTNSANAQSPMRADMPIPPDLEKNSTIIPGINHLRLAFSPEVYACIKKWMSEANSDINGKKYTKQ